MPVFGRLPVALSHGQGCWVWDVEADDIWTRSRGLPSTRWGTTTPNWCRPCRTRPPSSSTPSNYYYVPLQEQLAALLCEASGLSNVFCNSGLEANEAALKIARKFGHDKGIDEPAVIVFEGAFHGRSIATLSATANRKIQAALDRWCLASCVWRSTTWPPSRPRWTPTRRVGHLPETIQGEGGINPARIEFLQGLRRLCDERNLLLMLDEVQCGLGRTGKWFAHQWAGIQPDVMPWPGPGVGCADWRRRLRPRAAGVLTAGSHGSTFGGNPLAMRAGVGR